MVLVVAGMREQVIRRDLIGEAGYCGLYDASSSCDSRDSRTRWFDKAINRLFKYR